MKTIVTLDKANKAFGFPQLDKDGNLAASGSLFGSSSYATSASYAISASYSNSSSFASDANKLDNTNPTKKSVYQSGNTASGNYSVALGKLTTSTGVASFSEGYNTQAVKDYSHAEGGSTTASGYNAHAEGTGTTAGGFAAHAEGKQTTASGYYSHAEGTQTTASGYGSHAEGLGTAANAAYAHAEGQSTTASGGASHAEGIDSVASGHSSHAEGRSTASGQYSHAEGNSTTASGNSSHAEGLGTTASGHYQGSHAEGYNTTSSGGYGSHAEGNQTTASSYGSHAEGERSIASGIASHAEGFYAVSDAEYSHAENYLNVAAIPNSHAEGKLSITGIAAKGGVYTNSNRKIIFYSVNHTSKFSNWDSVRLIDAGTYTVISNLNNAQSVTYTGGNTEIVLVTALGTNYSNLTVINLNKSSLKNSAHAEGYNTIASGDYSHTEGRDTIASGYASHAEGGYTQATNNYSTVSGYNSYATGYVSTAEGYNTTASARYSHAEGQATTASGYTSHAEGNSTIASGNYSHAEGGNTTASGNSSHAEGNQTQASGNYSHTEGYGTRATGNSSHAEGYSTTASGKYSHTEGYGTTAIGQSSHAAGERTIASGSAQTAIGKYNTQNNTSSLFVIGNGTSDTSRSDLALFNSQSIKFNAPLTASIVSASFIGDGTNLYNIPASGIVGLNLSQIASGSATASISPDSGLQINVDTVITGSLNVTAGITGSLYGTSSYAETLNGFNSSSFVRTDLTDSSVQDIQGTLKLTGDIIAENYIISSSVLFMTQSYSSGSTKFGDKLDNTHEFTGSLLVTGSVIQTGGSFWLNGTNGNTPTSGAGTRFMWIPSKAALRAGTVDGTQWNDVNIGPYSVAFGLNNIASGSYTFIHGSGNTQSDYYGHGFIYGYNNTNSFARTCVIFGTANSLNNIDYSFINGYGNSINPGGGFSFIHGNSNTISSNLYGFAAGISNAITSEVGSAFGRSLINQSYNSFTVGKFNIATGTPGSWVNTDSLFAIGNGTSASDRNDAFRLNKNASGWIRATSSLAPIISWTSQSYVGVNIETPEYNLDINGISRFRNYVVIGGNPLSTPGANSLQVGALNSTGNSSLCVGYINAADGLYSISVGTGNNTAYQSSAFGGACYAYGYQSHAVGENVTARSYDVAAFGRFNIDTGTTTSWVATEPLFQIGNGTATTDRNDAFRLNKNASGWIRATSSLAPILSWTSQSFVGINIETPLYNLDVNGNSRISNGLQVTGSTILSGSLSLIGAETISGSLTVTGSTTLNGSGSNILQIYGTSGELFSVNDELTGDIFTVNSGSGDSIFVVNSDGYSMLNSKTLTSLTSSNTLYQFSSSIATAGFFDYYVKDSSAGALRAGTIMSVWSGSSVNMTDTSTTDLGASTTAVTFSMDISSSFTRLICGVATGSWDVKISARLI